MIQRNHQTNLSTDTIRSGTDFNHLLTPIEQPQPADNIIERDTCSLTRSRFCIYQNLSRLSRIIHISQQSIYSLLIEARPIISYQDSDMIILLTDLDRNQS